MTVLLVEDEALVRMMGVDVLTEAGLEVVEAGNADEAVAVLERRPDIRVLFTDIDMSGSMNGLALARLARQRWPSVGVLIVSGKVRPATDDMPPGGTFVPKPYQPATLVREVRQLLGSAR